MRGTAQDIGGPPPAGPWAREPQAPQVRPKPDLLTDQGRDANVGLAQPGGGDADPFSPPPSIDENTRPAPENATLSPAHPGHFRHCGTPPLPLPPTLQSNPCRR